MKSLILVLLLLSFLPVSPAFAQDNKPPLIPTNLEPINGNNIDRLAPITTFGFGIVRNLNWSSDGRVLAIDSETGVWLLSMDSPDRAQLLNASEIEPWMQQAQDRPTEDDIAAYRDLTEASRHNIMFSSSKTWLVAVEKNETRIWDLQNRHLWATIPLSEMLYAGGLTFNANGERLAAGMFDDQDNSTKIIVWDVRYAQEIAVLDGAHFGAILNIAFDPTGTLLSVVDINEMVGVWNIKTGVLVTSLDNHAYGVSAVTFSPDGSLLASGGGLGGDVRLWDIRTGRKVQTFRSAETWANELLFVDSDTLFVTGMCGPLDGWNLTAGEQTVQLGCKASHKDMRTAFSRDGKWIVGAWEYSEIINVWDVGTDTQITELVGHDDWVIATAFSPDGSLLASGSCDNTIRLWDTETWTEKAVLTEHNGSVWKLAFSPDGNLLVSAGSDGTARLWYVGERYWDTFPGTPIAILYTNKQQSNDFVFGPDGRLLVTSACQNVIGRGSKCSLVFWDVASVQPVRVIQTDHFDVTVAFNPDGTLFAVGTDAGGIELWGIPRP